jgi:hypothetical protein
MIEVTQAIKNATMGDFNGEISSSLAPRQSLSRVNKTEDVSTSFFPSAARMMPELMMSRVSVIKLDHQEQTLAHKSR